MSYNERVKKPIKWIVTAILVLWVLFGHPLSFIANTFWSESNAPWEKVDAFYYPDASDLSVWESQVDVGSIQECRDWVENSASKNGDEDLRQGDYECGVGCKSDNGFNICRLTIE